MISRPRVHFAGANPVGFGLQGGGIEGGPGFLLHQPVLVGLELPVRQIYGIGLENRADRNSVVVLHRTCTGVPRGSASRTCMASSAALSQVFGIEGVGCAHTTKLHASVPTAANVLDFINCLADPTCANGGDDFVRAEPVANGKRPFLGYPNNSTRNRAAVRRSTTPTCAESSARWRRRHGVATRRGGGAGVPLDPTRLLPGDSPSGSFRRSGKYHNRSKGVHVYFRMSCSGGAPGLLSGRTGANDDPRLQGLPSTTR